MKKILFYIVLLLSGASIAIAQVYPAQLQPFTLSGSGESLGDTTVTLTSFKSIDGVALTMSSFGSYGYGTLEPGSKTREEQIVFTGVTQNSNGTASLTGVKHVGFLYPFTQSSGLSKSHPGASTFIISNTSGFYNTFANLYNAATINNVWTFSSVTPPVYDAAFPVASTSQQLPPASWVFSNFVDRFNTQSIAGVKTFTDKPTVPDVTASDLDKAANVSYVNNVARQGVATATNVTSGVARLNIAAANANDPIAVGDNDSRLINKITNSFFEVPLIVYKGDNSTYFPQTSTYVNGIASDMATTSVYGPQYLFATVQSDDVDTPLGLIRLSLDYANGGYVVDNSIATMPTQYGGGYRKSPVVVGDYVYQFNLDSSNLTAQMKVVRTDKELTSTTTMSGFNPDTSTYNSLQENFFTDGTKIFEMVASSTPFARYTHIREWSIAGTVLTNTATVTLSTSSPTWNNDYNDETSRSFGYKDSTGNFTFINSHCYNISNNNKTVTNWYRDIYGTCTRTYDPTGTLLSTSTKTVFNINKGTTIRNIGIILFGNKLAAVESFSTPITTVGDSFSYRISATYLPR